jgi:hypothetical protein
MTTTDRLNAIMAKCRALVAVNEARKVEGYEYSIAGWRAIIAACDWALILLDCTSELDAGEKRMIDTLLAAWEDSL